MTSSKHIAVLVFLFIILAAEFAWSQNIDFYTPHTIYTMPELNEILVEVASKVAEETDIDANNLNDLLWPLQNHIDQNLIAHGKSATIYPQNIVNFIVKRLKAGDLPYNIGLDIVEEFSRGGFANLEGEKPEWQKVVVSVSKNAERVGETPATVILLTAEEIERRGYTDLEQILYDLPGFSISRTSGVTYSNIYQRGYRANTTERTLLLIDGVEENDLWSNFIYLSKQYPLSNIKSIEIVYGPASTMYGANAFVGVINIITKEPDDLIHSNKHFGFYSTTGYGNWKTRFADISMAAKYGDLSITVTGRFYKSDEMDLSNYPDWDFEVEDHDYYQNLLSISGQNENGEYLAQQYVDKNGLNPDHPYLEVIQNESGIITAINLSPEGAQRAREFDQAAMNATVDGDKIGYSNNTNDWLLYIKGRIENFQFGVQTWQRKEGALSWYTDQITSGYENGSFWIPRNTFFYIKYDKYFMENFSLTAFGRYKSHGLDGESKFLNYAGYSNGTLGLKELVADSTSYWFPTYYYRLSKQLRAELRMVYNHSEKFNIIGGFEFRNSLIQGNYIVSPEENPSQTGELSEEVDGGNYFNQLDVGVYLQSSYRLKRDIKLTLGGRMDYNRVRENWGFGTVFNPKFALVYTPGNFIFKTIYSEAFKDASSFTKHSSTSFRIANPNIQPEKVKNIEFSAGRQLSEKIFADVVAYNAKYSDVVGTAQIGDKTQNQAIGALHIWGIQARSQFSVGDYTFYGNYTYTKPINTKSEEGSEDVRIGDIPKHSFNLGGNAPLFDNVNVNLRMNYVGDRETGKNTTVDTNPYDTIQGYTIFNGALTYDEIYAGVSLQLVANNIFDADYFHPGVRSADGWLYAARVPQQGRNFVVKLITEF